MDAQLRLLGAPAESRHLRDLTRWLRHEPAFRGRVSTPADPDDNQMGSLTDVLVVALASGGAVSVLANSVCEWLRQRRSEISVELRLPDGKTVRLTAAGPVAGRAVDELVNGRLLDISTSDDAGAGVDQS